MVRRGGEGRRRPQADLVPSVLTSWLRPSAVVAMILFFCPEQARAHTNFSHCSQFVGCDQLSVIWPLWFPPHQFLCCVRVQQCCHVYTVAQHFQPFLRNMNFWLWLVKHNHRHISIINYTTKWLNVMRFFFTLQSNKWKGKKEKLMLQLQWKTTFTSTVQGFCCETGL